MPQNQNEIEKRLWDAADELRANSKLSAAEYSVPVLGLIFLRYADQKFATAEREIYARKCDAVLQHVYESYHGAGRSVYALSA